MYKLDNEDQRSVKDIDFYKNYLCVLYDKNEVVVYNVIDKTRVFRSIFRDATAIVSRLF